MFDTFTTTNANEWTCIQANQNYKLNGIVCVCRDGEVTEFKKESVDKFNIWDLMKEE